jgi:hypothetical protein
LQEGGKIVDSKKDGKSMKPFLEKIKCRPYWANNVWDYVIAKITPL